MIDKVSLNNRIHESAEIFLADIHLMTEDELKNNLRYFAEKAKDAAESILEEYIFEVVKNYTSGSFALSEASKLAAFVNLSNGYQQQMLDWIKNHPLEVKEMFFDCPKKNEFCQEKKFVSPSIIFGTGTMIAVGLFVFTNIWVALVAEILTLAFAKFEKKKLDGHRIDEAEIQQKKYELAIKAKKNQLVNGMIEELEKWLDMGEAASNNILSTLNIKQLWVSSILEKQQVGLK